MKAGRSSRTAQITAASRAEHARGAGPFVFHDPYAVQLLDFPYSLVRWRIFRVAVRAALGRFLDWGGQILFRSRFAEDLLADAVDAGTSQYVLLAAGLDSFCLRRTDLADRLRIYELDHPATQRAKQARLRAIRGSIPSNVEFVPIDLERETIPAALSGSTYRPDEPAFYSWLGCTMYLSQRAVFATLAAIASYASQGSEIVVDFDAPPSSAPPSERGALEQLMRYTARRSEPLVSFFEPAEFVERASALGFRLVELLSPSEQNERYAMGPNSELETIPIAFLAHFRLDRDGV